MRTGKVIFKKRLTIVLILVMIVTLSTTIGLADNNNGNVYDEEPLIFFDKVFDVLEWGGAITAVIIELDEPITVDELDNLDIEVFAVTGAPLGAVADSFEGQRVVRDVFLSETGAIEHTLIRNPVRPGGHGPAGTVSAESGRFVVVELRYGYSGTRIGVNGSSAVFGGIAIPGAVPGGGATYIAEMDYTVIINGVEADFRSKISPIFDDFILVNNPVEGFTMQQYRLLVPDGEGPFPIVIWAHGAGEGFRGHAATGVNNEGIQVAGNMGGIGWIVNGPEPTAVLAPQRGIGPGAPGGGASPAAIRAGSVAYIQYLIESGVVDANRVYVSGVSAGGAEAKNYLLENPEFFAGAFIICQVGAAQNNPANPVHVANMERIRHIPIWYFQGQMVPGHAHDFSTPQYNLLQSLNADDVRLTILYRIPGTEIPNIEFFGAEGFQGASWQPGTFPIPAPEFYPDLHWSWIPALNDGHGVTQDRILNGSMYDTTFMTWLFEQVRDPSVPSELNIANPNQLRTLLEEGDVILNVPGNLGIFVHHSPFIIPAGRTLYVQTSLNVHRDAELIIEGRLVVLPGARINNQGNDSTITIAQGGTLVNNNHIENVSGSVIVNNGTIVNFARFEIRANTAFYAGNVLLTPLNVHRNAIPLN